MLLLFRDGSAGGDDEDVADVGGAEPAEDVEAGAGFGGDVDEHEAGEGIEFAVAVDADAFEVAEGFIAMADNDEAVLDAGGRKRALKLEDISLIAFES